MKTHLEPTDAYPTRDAILKLLSDAEIAKVSTAETASGLLDGEEYLDLEHIEQGVRTSIGDALPMGRLLPRKAVHERTWTKILAELYS